MRGEDEEVSCLDSIEGGRVGCRKRGNGETYLLRRAMILFRRSMRDCRVGESSMLYVV